MTEHLPRQTERSWQEQVLKLAHTLGWRSYHSWLSIHSRRGFPDLVLVRRPRVIVAELKRQDREPTDEQQAWLDDLAACGVEAYCWKPSDWPEVEAILRRDHVAL